MLVNNLLNSYLDQALGCSALVFRLGHVLGFDPKYILTWIQPKLPLDHNLAFGGRQGRISYRLKEGTKFLLAKVLTLVKKKKKKPSPFNNMRGHTSYRPQENTFPFGVGKVGSHNTPRKRLPFSWLAKALTSAMNELFCSVLGMVRPRNTPNAYFPIRRQARLDLVTPLWPYGKLSFFLDNALISTKNKLFRSALGDVLFWKAPRECFPFWCQARSDLVTPLRKGQSYFLKV